MQFIQSAAFHQYLAGLLPTERNKTPTALSHDVPTEEADRSSIRTHELNDSGDEPPANASTIRRIPGQTSCKHRFLIEQSPDNDRGEQDDWQ